MALLRRSPLSRGARPQKYWRFSLGRSPHPVHRQGGSTTHHCNPYDHYHYYEPHREPAFLFIHHLWRGGGFGRCYTCRRGSGCRGCCNRSLSRRCQRWRNRGLRGCSGCRSNRRFWRRYRCCRNCGHGRRRGRGHSCRGNRGHGGWARQSEQVSAPVSVQMSAPASARGWAPASGQAARWPGLLDHKEPTPYSR